MNKQEILDILLDIDEDCGPVDQRWVDLIRDLKKDIETNNQNINAFDQHAENSKTWNNYAQKYL